MHLSKLLLSLAVILVSGTFFVSPLFAATSNFSVTVGNSPPAFSIAPAESTVSDITTPTDIGTTVTITAQADDPNGGDYYLIVCKTNQVQANNGSSPTCPGGQWCLSSAAASGNSASCQYTAQVSDAETNDWYAFVCDGISANAACSTASQGSDASGSPFFVNHSPSMSTVANNGSSIAVGSTVTWTTGVATSDPDIIGTVDRVKLIVCKIAGLSQGDCLGGDANRYCQSNLVVSNPSCSYGIEDGTPVGVSHAYAYVVDNHNLVTDSVNNGSDSSFNVTNAAPVISNILINGGSAITLTEGTTTPITVTATISDANGCLDIASVQAHLYRSGVNKAACIAGGSDDNNCYPNVTCTASGTGDVCTGAGDSSADYNCVFNLSYVADPTDALTQYPSQDWVSTVTASDAFPLTGTLDSSGIELNSLAALNVSSSIDYGTLTVGQKNDPIDRSLTVTSTGNVGIDVDLSGTNLSNGNDSIPVGQQKYALTSVAYDSATALTTSPVSFVLGCHKSTVAATPATKGFYWGISIPTGIEPGNYSGTNTITAVKSEVTSW